MTRRRNIFVAALAGAAIVAAAALAAATPVTPPPGAVVKTARPDFTWTLPANEESDAIFVAAKADVTPEGKFYDENIVDADVLDGKREWSPSSPLYAGQYWWNIWSHDVNTFASFYSVPAGFTIPVSLRLRRIKTKRQSLLHALQAEVRWTANVKRPLIRVRLLRGKRLIWKAAAKDYGSIGSLGSTSFTWRRPRGIEQGTRLKLVASISSGRVARARVVVVRAP